MLKMSLILIFFGTFFCADAIASMIYYGGYNIPQVGRVIRVIFGSMLIAFGISDMLLEDIPLYVIVCFFCIISILCGYLLGKSF
ncbi:hypothetical protein MTLP_05870 [Candidatus Methanoliparum sp. LAM-1]|nr:hypothetical protein MTLP_05870 [Candidatus Methanoliparum sp. LAM-1]